MPGRLPPRTPGTENQSPAAQDLLAQEVAVLRNQLQVKGRGKRKKNKKKKKKGSQSSLTRSRDKNTAPPAATAEDVRAMTQAPQVFTGRSLPGSSQHAINLRDALDFIKTL